MNPLFQIVSDAFRGKQEAAPAPMLRGANEPSPDFLTEDQIGALQARMIDMKRQALTVRRREELFWELSWRFYHGDHWVRTHQNMIVPVPVTSPRPRITANRIVTGVETRVAHLLKNRPKGSCAPRTTDEEDRDAARTGDKIVDYYANALTMRERDWTTTLWTQVTGNCFQKIYWDNQKGPKGKDDKPLGDPDMAVCFPYEILPDPAATNIEDCEALIHSTMKPLWWTKKNYERAADLSAATNVTRDMLPSMYAEPGTTSGLLAATDRVNIVELWQKPSEDYPDGLYAIFGNDKFLAAMATPKGYDPIPFVHFVDKKTASFWGHSSVRHAYENNRQLNIAKSQLAFHRQANRGKTMVPFEAGINEDDWNDEDDEIVRYAHGYGPTAFTPAGVSETHLKEIQMLEKDISDSFGNSDIMRGEATGETRSGKMLAYEQEYAGTVLGLPATSIELGIQRRSNLLLRLVKQYATEERYISYVGRDRQIETLHFKSSDLDGVSDYVVEVGSAIPASMASLRDNAVELMKSGAVPVNVGLRMMGTPSDVTEMMEKEQPDRDRANEENAIFAGLTDEKLMTTAGRAQLPPGHAPSEMMKALGIEVRDFEDHEVHIPEHDKFRKSRAYRKLTPAAQMLADEHVNAHKAFVAAALLGKQGALEEPPPPEGEEAPPGAPAGPLGSPAALVPGHVPPGGGAPGGGPTPPAPPLPRPPPPRA